MLGLAIVIHEGDQSGWLLVSEHVMENQNPRLYEKEQATNNWAILSFIFEVITLVTQFLKIPTVQERRHCAAHLAKDVIVLDKRLSKWHATDYYEIIFNFTTCDITIMVYMYLPQPKSSWMIGAQCVES